MDDVAMLFASVVMIGTAFIVLYLIGKDNDK